MSRRPPSAAPGGADPLHGVPGSSGDPGQGRVLGKVGFWVTFVAGWVGFFGLLSISSILEGGSMSPAVVMTAAPALLAVVPALARRKLANPDRPLLLTALILAAAGLAYALSSGVLTLLLIELLPESANPVAEEGKAHAAVAFGFYAFILYAILVGFLLWTESLKRIHESRALAAREAVLRAEAEAKALRAQFNPHFVFNTLHSLMLLVREDPGTAERAIEDVASLIRYASSLERRGQDTVSLGQELEMARRYLALEALRLEDRLRVAWEVDDALAELAIPAFSLQTLLENAIKHGLSPRPEGGRIRVVLEREDGEMLLKVEDDGMGADPRRVSTSQGSGLRLLERRMETLYGDGAFLSWSTAPGEGFRVELRWPARPAPAPGEGR